jgi:hypothetical protein
MTVTESPFQLAMTQGAEKVDVSRIKGTPTYTQLVAECDNKFNLAKQYRQQFEKQWYMNLAFYFGRQYVQWSTASATPTARLVEGQVPPWRVRLVSNKVRRYVRKELSKCLKEKPMGFVVPQSADDDDLAAARAGGTLAEYFWRTKQMPTHIRRAMFWTLLCGTGFIKDWYDDNYVPDPDAKYTGDMFIERITPFHLYVPDVQEEEMENQPYVIHATAKNKDTVARLYNVEIATGDVDNNAGMLEQRFLSAMDIKESSSKDMTYVKEIWIKPNAKYPDGAVIAWTGNTILHFQEGWPFLHKDYPFTKFDHIPSGKFYSDSTIVDLIPLQKEYNRTNSQLVEAKNKMAKPQLIAPQGSIDPNKVTSEPGLIITYQPGFAAPTPMPLIAIPSYVENTLERCNRDMDDVASQHEISKGNSPGGITAATAISFLQEEDDSVLGPTLDSMEKGVEKITRHMLNYVGAHWDVERTVQVVGQNGQIEVVMLNKDKLRSNYSYTIQAGSSTPRSLAAKQAFIMELGKMGWIPPDKALRYLNMPDVGRLYEEMQLDTRFAQRENLKMQFTDPQQLQPQPPDPNAPPQMDPNTGQPVPPQPTPPPLPVKVNSWDDHFAHIMEHDAFRKTQSFEALDPANQAMFQEHVNQHKVYILVKRGIQMPMIMQAMNDPMGVGLDSLLAQPMGMPPPVGGPQPIGGIPGGPPDLGPGHHLDGNSPPPPPGPPGNVPPPPNPGQDHIMGPQPTHP